MALTKNKPKPESEFAKDRKAFYRHYNIYVILAFILIFLAGIGLITAGFYVVPTTAPQETVAMVDQRQISFSGNLFHFWGSILAGVPVLALVLVVLKETGWKK